MSIQPSLFDAQFDSRIRRIQIGDTTHFSVLDTYLHYGNSSNPTRDWKRDVKELKEQGYDVLPDLVDWRPDGQKGGRGTPFASIKVFLRIAQVATFKEWEPLRQWMADVAHERFEEMVTPGLGTQRARQRDLDLLQKQGLGKSEAAEFLQDRIDGIDTYKQLMATIFQICDQPKPGEIVNTEYVDLFGMASSQLKIVLGTKTIRDRLPKRQRDYLRIAENDLNDLLQQHENITMSDLLSIIDRVVVPLGDRLRSLCAELKIDPVTGKKLLKDGE